ncbi:heterokaryon incompatibility protein-domain-containing protein [Xylaria acuta]|nr:heterokaryon incompatibility protein-domain-containing protein [Xylaria acuta]
MLWHIRNSVLPKPNSWRQSKRIPSLFWADAVCINQEDETEKSHQVTLMRTIYQNAFVVISWMGPDDDGLISLAIKWLSLIASEMRRKLQRQPDDDVFSWMRRYPEIFRTGDGYPLDNKIWNAIHDFLHLSYWRRIWILQEMVLAKSSWMISGDVSIDYDSLTMAWRWSEIIQYHRMEKPSFFPAPLWNRLALPGYVGWEVLRTVFGYRGGIFSNPKNPYGSARKLSALLYTKSYHATDPRDKIYGLLGLIESDITPDYSRSVVDLYCEAAEKLLKEVGSLEPLNVAGIHNSNATAFGLPSWVPNWHDISMGDQNPIAPQPYRADEGIKDFLSGDAFKVVDRTLNAHGFVCESVDRVEPDFDNRTFFQFCCDYVSRDTGGDFYITGIPRLQAIFRTVFMDVHPETVARFSRAPHRFAFEFIRDIIPEDDIQNAAALLRCLGLHPGEEFLESYRRRFYDTAGVSEEELRLLLEASLRFDKIHGPDDFLCLWLHVKQSVLSDFSVYAQIIRALHHRFFHTANGHLGLGPPATLPGDLVCVLSGCTMPLILRRVDSHYVLVGQCHVLGLMDGEGVQRIRRDDIVEFQIV